MTTYFVSRHPGAIAWAKSRNLDAVFVEHIEIKDVEEGDMVMGSLPVSKVAELNAKGVRYKHLILHMTRDDRGRELTVEDMVRLKAKLVEYHVVQVKGE